MKTIKWNGEYWYVDRRSAWLRLRTWLIWVGGWESSPADKPHQWRFRTEGHPPPRYRLGPTPVSVAGHRVTFFGWGLQVRLRHAYLVWEWNPYRWHGQRWGRCYVSPNGTPRLATHWLWGYSDTLLRHAHQRGGVRDVG